MQNDQSNVVLETLSTPVEEAVDVLVLGSGSAGIGAALAAARLGAKTLIVDPAGYPGGTLVSGLPLLGFHDGEKQVVYGIASEMFNRLKALGAAMGDVSRSTCVNVDPERLKLLIIEMLAEAKVSLRLHTLFARAVTSEGTITHAVVEGKAGRRALAAKIFIDATGDGDLAESAGAPMEKGRREDGKMQSMTLMFAVGNIDTTRYEEWGGYDRMVREYIKVSESEHFRNPRRTDLSGSWGSANRIGERAFNVTRILGYDGSDAKSLTEAEIEGRTQAWEFLERFLKPHVPGFENAFISWTAGKIGVRETRRIVGEYVLNENDIVSFRKFDDTVVCGSYPIDIHSPTGDGTRFLPGEFYGGRYWTIPYRSLVPLNVDNLLVAGRCLSATHEALSAVRCMANTIAMGEAAGTAAALALREGKSPRNLDVRCLQTELIARGAWLGDFAASPVTGVR
ncbi:MAG: FAD-dependent oxidoreductase [Capsulimonadaceae bacterium]|nr:FAD-dependent oxidoreductase [Capsulimonadaceae bacterium]